jgi:threonine/homoserine/homoserine lactone efflux protein
MTGLVIFTVIAMAGCVFLIYFMFALWRDSRAPRRGKPVEIRRLPSPRKDKGKVLHLYSAEDLGAREKKRL